MKKHLDIRRFIIKLSGMTKIATARKQKSLGEASFCRKLGGFSLVDRGLCLFSPYHRGEIIKSAPIARRKSEGIQSKGGSALYLGTGRGVVVETRSRHAVNMDFRPQQRANPRGKDEKTKVEIKACCGSSFHISFSGWSAQIKANPAKHQLFITPPNPLACSTN